MEKDIYIIKNKINGKVYIGQSVKATSRWSAHRSEARLNKPNDTSILHKAMRKYGVENFSYSIIERTVDYNIREQYYIDYYNSLVPYGYNISKGGEGNRKVVPEEEQKIIDLIKNELRSSNKSLGEIGEKFNLTLKRISAINRGMAYYSDKDTYPLRVRDNDTLIEEDLLLIQELLITTNLSMREISRRFNCNTMIVRDINKGKRVFNSNIKYPIRNNRPDYVDSVIYDIINTKLSLRAIAKKHNINNGSVSMINLGKYYHDPNLTYPLRG